jgi:hypothetical protein
MTGPKSMKINDIASYLRDAVTIGAAICAIFTATTYAIFALWGHQMAAQAAQVLGLDKLATQEDVRDLTLRVDDLSSKVSTISGDQRIVTVDLIRSFVKSPVGSGGQIDAVIYAKRTERGSACILTRAATVFETESGLRVPGPERAAAGQLPNSMTRLRFQYDVPDLPSGRTGVWMVGSYDCPWGRTVEEHGPLIFQMEG